MAYEGQNMKTEIAVPRMGESISEATIGVILKPSGEFVKADDEILELETDKVNQVIYAPTSGVLTLIVKQNDSVKIGDLLGHIDEAEAPVEKPELKVEKMQEELPLPSKPTSIPKEPLGARKSKEAFIEDLKNLAKEPSGPVPKSHLKNPLITRTPLPLGRGETRKKLSKIRRVIAERMVQAQATTASLTTFNEVDLTQVMLIRDRFKEAYVKEYGIKLGLMSFFVKATISALKEYPEINAYLDGDELVYREYLDIGIAVSTDRGVIVPVLRDCDNLSFAEIELAIDAYAQQARQGKISIDDLQGGGFTITNGGVFGSLLSTPILSPPQTGILGMHKVVKRPVAISDQILIRPMMYVALTYDHRVIDGREAVSFLVHIKQRLEDPTRLLLEI
ncbi:Dihydrolipoyllysine-residue succinyltransferase component of 2-oxoglutarate dehydrogenase complex [Chlamydiales bacterium STE3]|nr:Dihydrolipoyllysine-residue succinyltransferase component of 2-oxoglutarate dehydrogenase complex [Chlamydiales bacterium STE3]